MPTQTNTDVMSMIANKVDDLYEDSDDMYEIHRIPKSSGGTRLLEEPEPELKKCQNFIKDNILYQIKPTDNAFGFRRGISLVKAGKKHTGMPLVIRVDITEFFHNVTEDKLIEMFEEYFNESDYEPVDLEKMVKVMCKEGRLPMGAPSSPPATNIVCRRMDSRINAICERLEDNSGSIEIGGETTNKHDYVYTRYADDLVVSTTDKENGTDIIPQIREIVEDEGFSLNEEKTRIMREGRRQTVLGMTVNAKTNIPREKREQTRARLHNLFMDLKRLDEGDNPADYRPDDHPQPDVEHPVDVETGEVINSGILQQISGYVAFALDVNPMYGRRWQKKFNQIEEWAEEQGYI